MSNFIRINDVYINKDRIIGFNPYVGQHFKLVPDGPGRERRKTVETENGRVFIDGMCDQVIYDQKESDRIAKIFGISVNALGQELSQQSTQTTKE